MKVYELINKLKTLPQDAECYLIQFERFLNSEFKPRDPLKDAFVDLKEQAEVYDLDVEHKTVYSWDTRNGKYIPYVGVMFEVD